MIDRLVLGSSSLGHTIAEELAGGRGDVRVVTDDENREAALVADGVSVTAGDPTAAATLRPLDPPDVVVTAAETPDRNLAAARAARSVFSGATLVAYTGESGTGHVTQMREVADRIVDRCRETAGHILERAGDEAVRLRELQHVLRGLDRLAVVAHDNPDPDAIASGVALARLAERVGCDPEVCYYGDISHQENRAFVNLLDIDLRNLGPGADLSEYDGFALVDHSRPGVNDQLPEDLPVDVVIDHHPPRASVDASFVDLRSEAGATSTLLVDYLDHLDASLTEDLATALLFGIRVDTDEFTRETSQTDFEAAATLLPHANLETLARAASPSVSPTTFDTLADAISNQQQRDETVVSGVGRLPDRDALAQAADRLLDIDGVATTVVHGVRDGTVYISARSRGTDFDLGGILRDAFEPIGSAGGHADMAGAQITLGVLEAAEDHEELPLAALDSIVADRFFDALEQWSTQAVVGVHPDEYGSDQYLVPPEQRPVVEVTDDLRAEYDIPGESSPDTDRDTEAGSESTYRDERESAERDTDAESESATGDGDGARDGDEGQSADAG
jgi:Exopolyphosphatase-related proteins